MKGLGTDHVISGPIRGLVINFTFRGYTDIVTLRLNWPSEKTFCNRPTCILSNHV